MSFSPNHILVPVDVDPLADRALADRLVDDAAALALKLGAKLSLIHVAVPTLMPMLVMEDATGDAYRAMSAVLEARVAASHRRLGELDARARAAGAVPHTEFITREGTIPEAITAIALEMHAELIMMTTHGRKGVKRFFLGSVAERTAHLARTPILLLPP